LSRLARDCGTPESKQAERPLDGDELLPDAVAQATQSITIAARPEAVWPWLVQMGCRRGGFYAFDVLDNGGRPSAREVHPKLTRGRRPPPGDA
jgi:proline iminopeptidase